MTNEQMARCFNEWMRRFIDNPEEFEREFESVGSFLRETNEGTEPSYGEQCTAYMTDLSSQIAS